MWKLAKCSLLLTFCFVGSSDLPVSVVYQNSTVSGSNQTKLQIQISVNNNAVSGLGNATTVDINMLTHVRLKVNFTTPRMTVISMERLIEVLNATADPPLVQLVTTLTHEPSINTSSPLSGVVLKEDLSGGLQAYLGSGLLPAYNTPGLQIVGRTIFTYTPNGILDAGSNVTLQYSAEPSGDQGRDLPQGETVFTSYVCFEQMNNSYGPFPLDVCIKAIYDIHTNTIYEHGYTALSFFLAMLLGFILVALGVLLFLLICRRCRESSISPHEHRIREKGRKIVLDAKAAMKKGLNAIKDYSIIAWNESLVLVWSLKDKLHMFRETDNLDVLATIHVDVDLEQEQNDATVQTTLLLVRGLRQNGDITQKTEDQLVTKFNTQVKEFDKKHQAEYKKQLEALYMDVSAKNKEKLAELLNRHKQEKAKALTLTKDLPEKERDSLVHTLQEQHNMEENELTFTLALEQNEGGEKLRKEFAISRRMVIKELLQNLVNDTITQGQLNTEQADWLIKEHKKQQDAVHRMFDEEISRQRMVLEEKLARRRALAQAAETQEDDCKEILNLNANHLVGYLQKGKKQSMLSAEQAEEWIDELKTKSMDIKAEMEAARKAREEELHKKLSQNKISQLLETMKRQSAEVDEYVNKSKAQQTEAPVDPVSYAEGLLKIKSQHRVELADLENQLDAEHAQVFAEMIDKTAQTAIEEMKTAEQELQGKLKEEGMTEKMIAMLLKKHEAETEDLKRKQANNRKNQEIKLKEELARHKREWAARREKERQEQEDLREHEADVVEKLVFSQMSISEEERNRIMKEHEKQMVLLENSLTLNKLRQQRALEERLSQRRAQQMSKLQAQQQSELTKLQKTAENSGEEDSEDTRRATLELMKHQAQQRIAIIQGQQLDIDDELEQIRIEMMKERALALCSQEERLGAMISALQMEKAREMTKIEEQQKAINNLKANLMDDLSDRGILTASQCEQILQNHRSDQEQMNKKLDRQRQKQEEKLKEKLHQRLQQQEKTLFTQHEKEMKRLLSGTNRMASKVRQMMLMHKHMLKMEIFRNRMNREMMQVLEETQRKFEINKLQIMQEQELGFIAGLVRIGAFQQNELLDVLHLLFPTKTEEDIHSLLARITEGIQMTEKQNASNSRSSLVERVHNSKLASAAAFSSRLSLRSGGGNMKTKKETQMSSVNPEANIFRGSKIHTSSYANSYLSDNEDNSTDYIGLGVSMSHDMNPAPTGRLPPLTDQTQPKKQKKKKKFLKKHVEIHDEDNASP